MLDRLSVLLLYLLVFTGCHKAEELLKSDSESEIHVYEVPGDEIKIPSLIWDILEGKADLKKLHGTEEKKSAFAEVKEKADSISSNSNIVFVPIKVILTEKTPGVLGNKTHEFDFKRGGGKIDLSKIVKDKQGTFHVKFDFEKADVESVPYTYYVSYGRKRRVNGKVFGSGCGNFFDVQKYMDSVMSKEGIAVNTTRSIHTSVLAGTFVFAIKRELQLDLAQVTFTDSENKNLICKADSKIEVIEQ